MNISCFFYAQLAFIIFLIVIIYGVYMAQKNSSITRKEDVQQFDSNPLGTNSPVVNILQWEFEYIKCTASEAISDQHTLVKFYLIITGIIVSGVITIIKKNSGIPPIAASTLLWGFCLIGTFYFLKIIRLRQAWHDSALAMNRIKKTFTLNSGNQKFLQNAFQWDVDTLPKTNKRWTVFHYSAMLIGFINTVAYASGAGLLYYNTKGSGNFISLDVPDCIWVWIVLSSFGLFRFHDMMYRNFLAEKNQADSANDTNKI